MYLQCKTFKWKTAYEGDQELRLSPEYQFNEFAKENKIKIKSALDICCGASNLLEVFNSHGIKCEGTETRQGMIDYSKEKCPEISYYLTKNIRGVCLPFIYICKY